MAICDTIFSMDNFFSTQANVEDNSLNSQYDNLKDNYEKIFIEAAESIRREVNAFKPEDACKKCNIKDCKIEKKDMFAAYPPACPYRDWQLKILTFLSGDYRQKLKAIYKNMMEKKNNYSCNNCAACCKLAASQYSYEQLKQRAMRGDKFAKDFVSVFVPYKSEEDAKKLLIRAIDSVDIVKLSQEELTFLTGEKDIKQGVKLLNLDNKITLITCGENGSYYIYQDLFLKVESKKVTPIDTTGAGDGFLSYMLYKIGSFDLTDEKEVLIAMKNANTLGAYVTQKKGAIINAEEVKNICFS